MSKQERPAQLEGSVEDSGDGAGEGSVDRSGSDNSQALKPDASSESKELVLASRLSRGGAALLDGLLLVLAFVPLLTRVYRLVQSKTEAGALPVPDFFESPVDWIFSAALALLLGLQWGLLARRGQSLGKVVAGVAVFDRQSSRIAGFVQGVILRRWPRSLLAFGFALIASTQIAKAAGTGPELGLFLSLAFSFPSWFLLIGALDSLFVLGRSRLALHDRVAKTRVVLWGGEEKRAYQPPRFSGAGFFIAGLGLSLSLLVAGLVWVVVSQAGSFESTEMDIPGLVAAVVAILGVVAAGALAAFVAQRFLVGELALGALLVALVAYELMLLDVLQVPALQQFAVPGHPDWAVYGAALFFGLSLFFIIGSALGFMVAGDDGADFSSRFERLVARRHLRLKLSHYALLGLVATLVPVIVYGLFIWPIVATLRLVRGQKVKKPLPPTVFMALLTIVGVMFGVMSLTVVLAVMKGFEQDLKDKILGTNAHGVVHRYIGEFSEWKEVEGKIKEVPGVRGITPFIMSEVMITTESAVTGAVLKGIEVDSVGQVTDLEKNVEAGRIQDLVFAERIPKSRLMPPDDWAFDPDAPEDIEDEWGEDPADKAVLPGIVVGREMARSLRVYIGDRLTVMNPMGEIGPQGPIPRSRTYRVAAIFYSGMYEYDAKFAYIDLAEAQSFFRMGEGVSGLELRFGNVDEARPMMRRILGVLEGFPYRVKDWGEMNKNLFSALRLERIVMFILLSFQVLIACICVIATLVMLVVEKRKEVATLKAMGAREGSIMKLFVLEGLIIGAIGTLYGVAAGLMFCQVVDWVKLDPEVYYISNLPVVIEPFSVVMVAVVAMLLVFVATIYPARRGGSIAPVEGFREE